MNLKLPVVLLSLALAAPGAMSEAKDNGNKNKNKDKKEQKSDDRQDGDHRDGDHHDNDGDGKMTICHIPPGNRSARHTISIGDSAWPAHQNHGDHRGACAHPGGNPPDRPDLFRERDTNHDDRLSFAEFQGDRARFDRLDRNDDGSLTRLEYYRR